MSPCIGADWSSIFYKYGPKVNFEILCTIFWNLQYLLSKLLDGFDIKTMFS